MQLHATYAMIYILDKLWIILIKDGIPTEIYGKTIKLNHDIKDQFALIIHYKKISQGKQTRTDWKCIHRPVFRKLYKN